MKDGLILFCKSGFYRVKCLKDGFFEVVFLVAAATIAPIPT